MKKMMFFLCCGLFLVSCGTKEVTPKEKKTKFYRVVQVDKDGKRTPGKVVRIEQ